MWGSHSLICACDMDIRHSICWVFFWMQVLGYVRTKTNGQKEKNVELVICECGFRIAFEYSCAQNKTRFDKILLYFLFIRDIVNRLYILVCSVSATLRSTYCTSVYEFIQHQIFVHPNCHRWQWLAKLDLCEINKFPLSCCSVCM